MPRYFFDLYNDMISRDEEGAELPDVEAARARAVQECKAMAAHEVSLGALNLTHFIKVRDESGRSLFAVRFDEAVNVENCTPRGAF